MTFGTATLWARHSQDLLAECVTSTGLVFCVTIWELLYPRVCFVCTQGYLKPWLIQRADFYHF